MRIFIYLFFHYLSISSECQQRVPHLREAHEATEGTLEGSSPSEKRGGEYSTCPMVQWTVSQSPS